MLTEAQVIAEWSRRQSAAWRAIRIPLVVLVAAAGGFWYVMRTPTSDMSGVQLLASLLIFCAFGGAMLLAILRTLKLYRCPRCNELPGDDGVALFPKRCPKCNAVLRSPH